MSFQKKLFTASSYFKFLHQSKNQYSIHSPFVYDLYTNCIDVKTKDHTFNEIEELRSVLEKSKEVIDFSTFGVASRANSNTKQKIGSIAKNSLASPRKALLLYQIAKFLKPQSIIELGTSLGTSTLNLALGAGKQSQTITFEGNPALIKKAKQSADHFPDCNIDFIQGNIDETLKPRLDNLTQVDLAYIDANHAYEPSVRYYELLKQKSHNETCIIFDDIYWSKGMNAAWQKIIRDNDVTVSIDLFHVGLIFFRKEQRKEDFKLRL